MKGYRKLAVATLALIGGVVVALARPEAIGAYGSMAGTIALAYMGAHAVQDSKLGR